MPSPKYNLATHQVLLVGVTAGSPLCSELLLGHCWEEGRLQLVLAGAALLGHGFHDLLALFPAMQWFFWGYIPPGAWSHQGREEVSLKNRSCSHAALQTSDSGSCAAPSGGEV